ncbi:1-deoxy-D-xylulose-5-phosphate synthase [Streptosporangium becharense]|uniref:1-deoxy-D-xylulose-5-phosphate synthase n=1 Tax=Streptosporangium becharense TaxID=1816182 RepID=A0A7W9IBY0_9ACTN|nr:1-deoxy-D-xylulose-5-phosphate synthase [Streptosporangium becharense]MBB2913811.1 1-deoxy-D-xylulose-5-phosphate synthase [Streptosporangium becharense]MBB5817892.1 1-deoxy-D-xylulose-5-phosphate synthase [Streptosporangium becharense]
MLADIRSPRDLKDLTPAQLVLLGMEIRSFLVESVSRTGGHLGPNLGVVELTLALHRVFDSPHDRILWDTGHQAYVHKLLTGRQDFSLLRKRGGLSGYPSRAESEHDVIENSHASTALSYADGLARAVRLRGVTDRVVVAVVGDGALTGGMAWEALNNLAAAPDLPVIIVLNDNGRSYTPTVGGLAGHLAALRAGGGYADAPPGEGEPAGRVPATGAPGCGTQYGTSGSSGSSGSSADTVTPRGWFGDLGLAYIGPVDGHDIAATEAALRAARELGRPVVVHCVTRKGRGYRHAEEDPRDRFHGIGVIDAETGRPVATASPRTWTSVFAEEMVQVGAGRPDVVALTAAMLHPAGLDRFADAYPDRVIDVGIAEQHAATSAAGLAAGGLHPVVAIYATFLNRAFDQVLMDVALHRAGVTFVLDRAGVTGDDGPSHNGMWDMSILQVVPGLRLAAPRDATRLREQLWEAVAVRDAPTVLRFPKGPAEADVTAVDRIGGLDVLARSAPAEVRRDLLLVSVGAMAGRCVQVADRLTAHGVGVTVVDPRWVKPIDEALPALAAEHALVVTVEDGARVGGVGAALAQTLHDAGVTVPCHNLGVPAEFLPVAGRSELMEEIGLSTGALEREILRLLARRTGAGRAVPAAGRWLSGRFVNPIPPGPPARTAGTRKER